MMPLLADAPVAEVLVNWHTFFFLLFALVACAFALGVVVASNVVHMAFYLIISLGATAGLFMLAGAEFLGAMQLMIYVGGTLVLLIFGVMLTGQSRFVSLKTSGAEWVLGVVVGGALLAVLVQAAVSVESWRAPREAAARQVPGAPPAPLDQSRIPLEDSKNVGELGLGLLGVRPDALPRDDRPISPQQAAGFSGYLLVFEIVSVHLLVVLVGAAYLARTKRRVAAEPAATGGDGTAGNGPAGDAP